MESHHSTKSRFPEPLPAHDLVEILYRRIQEMDQSIHNLYHFYIPNHQVEHYGSNRQMYKGGHSHNLRNRIPIA